MKYIIIFCFTLLIINASAQDDYFVRHSYAVGFGLNTCIPNEDNTNPNVGYSVSFEYNYHFSDKLYLHSGLSFSRYVFSRESSLQSTPYENIAFGYLDIPIELSFRFNNFSLNAGVSKSLLSETGLGANLNIGYTINKTKTHKQIEIILPSIKYITDLSEMDGNSYLIIESKLLFSF